MGSERRGKNVHLSALPYIYEPIFEGRGPFMGLVVYIYIYICVYAPMYEPRGAYIC